MIHTCTYQQLLAHGLVRTDIDERKSPVFRLRLVALFHLPRLRLSPIFRPRPIRRLQTPRLNHQPSLEPAIRAAVQAFVIDLFDTFKQAFFRPLVSTIYRAFDLAIWVTKSLDKALFVAFEQA